MATILRVLADGAAHGDAEMAWALYDNDRLLRGGRGPASQWPDASVREAVLAAPLVRLAHVSLPPMGADRAAQAVAFALEDQVAGPAGAHHLAVSARTGDGFDVAIVSRAVVAPLARAFDRVIAEAAAAPRPARATWRWYRSGVEGSFVRRADGSAFAVGPVEMRASLPPELSLPLRHAARANAPVTAVEAAFAVDDAQLRVWSEEAGVPFTRADAWRWDQDGVALSSAFDLLQGDYARVQRATPRPLRATLRWAAGLVLAAILVHVAATAFAWGTLRYRHWQAEREIVAAARNADVAETGDAQQASALLAARQLEARHRIGSMAPSDALPLLARAAPSLARLPPGTLKSATYTANAWTLDLGKVDPAIATNVERGLASAGLATMMATTAAGTRLRVAASDAGAIR